MRGPLVADSAVIERVLVGSVEMVPVAAPGHPLARSSRCPGAGRDHVQLILSDRSPLTESRDFSVMSARTWRLADLGAKHAPLREGIGWNMPLPMVAGDLALGTLVAMPDHPGGTHRFSAIRRRDTPPVRPRRGCSTASRRSGRTVRRKAVWLTSNPVLR